MSTSPVEVIDHTGTVTDADSIVRLVEAVMLAEGARGEIVVAFVGEEVIAELNGRYRGEPEPTDVLSFPQDPGACWPGEADELGEVVVCPQVVFRYSLEEGVPVGQQMGWTLVHGVLHLLGYDHERDRGEMRERERQILHSVAGLVGSLSLRHSGLQGASEH